MAFVCSLRGSLIRLRAITNLQAAAPSGESPLACTRFPSDRTAALGGRARCSALFELEYLQFSLPLHPSLFCQGSQTRTHISEPERSSVEIFTGRIVHYVSVPNACEGYYSNGKQTETDCSPRLCLEMGLSESHIGLLAAKKKSKKKEIRSSNPVTQERIYFDTSRLEMKC